MTCGWGREQAQWFYPPGGCWGAFARPASIRFGITLFPVPAHRTGLAENRTGRFPASGSRKRHTMLRVTPSATSEHNLGWLDSSSIPHVLRRLFLRSLPETFSHNRNYQASSVLRASPPPHTARPVSRELPVDP